MSFPLMKKHLEQLTSDMKVLDSPGASGDWHYASSVWDGMRRACENTAEASLNKSSDVSLIQTNFGMRLVEILKIAPSNKLTSINGCHLDGCIEAEPRFHGIFDKSQRPPATSTLPIAPPIMLEGDGIEAIMKFDGEPSILSLKSSSAWGTVEGGLYGVEHLRAQHLKYTAIKMGKKAIVPVDAFIQKTGPLVPIRLTNFALDPEIRANASSELGKEILGTADIRAKVETLLSDGRLDAEKTGLTILKKY